MWVFRRFCKVLYSPIKSFSFSCSTTDAPSAVDSCFSLKQDSEKSQNFGQNIGFMRGKQKKYLLSHSRHDLSEFQLRTHGHLNGIVISVLASGMEVGASSLTRCIPITHM